MSRPPLGLAEGGRLRAKPGPVCSFLGSRESGGAELPASREGPTEEQRAQRSSSTDFCSAMNSSTASRTGRFQ